MPKRLGAKRQIVRLLEQRNGLGEKWIELFERIASGEAVKVPTDIPGVMKTLTPTISEMMYAGEILLAYQHGRPKQSVEVEVDDRRSKVDYDNLSLQDIEQLERISRKATVSIDNVVEGQFLPEGKKP